MRISFRYLFCLVALCLFTAVSAQQPAITARISPSNPKVGEPFQYILESEIAFEPAASPKTANDTIRLTATQPNRMIQNSDVNGRVSQRVQYTWNYLALREGPFTIDAISVRAEGKLREIAAVEGTVGAVQQVKFGDFKNIGQVSSRDRGIMQQYSGRFFSAVEISNMEPFLYEPVIVTTVLYREFSDQPISKIDVSAAGGARQAVLIENSARFLQPFRPEPITIDGRKFARIPVMVAIIVPTMAGECEVTGAELNIGIGQDFFFGRSAYGFAVTSPFDTIMVKPLPSAPSESITQLVGDFTIGAGVDRHELNEGDLLTLTVTISGKGFLETVSLDAMPEIEGLSFVSQEIGTATNQPDIELVSRKVFNRVYQVSRPGEIQIPALTFAVVNPATGELESRDTEPITVSAAAVARSSLHLPSASASQDRGRARQVGEAGGILYIDTSPLTADAIAASRTPIALRPFYIIAHVIPLILLFGYAGWTARQRRLNLDVSGVLARKARSRADAALKEARQQKSGAPAAEFYFALSAGIRNHIAAAVRREAAGLTNEEAGVELRRRGVDNEVAREIVSLLDRCDEMRYAPASADSEREADLNRAQSLMNSLGRLR